MQEMKPKIIAETERLFLRELTDADYPGLCRVFQDKEVTYYYDKTFTNEEIRVWLGWQLRNYDRDGFGIWAVVLKESGEMIGHSGISVRQFSDEVVYEIGYMFEKAFWGRGYATEAAIACRELAFGVYGFDRVCSIIRTDNMASRAVARKNGMQIKETVYRMMDGKALPHYMYSIDNPSKKLKT